MTFMRNCVRYCQWVFIALLGAMLSGTSTPAQTKPAPEQDDVIRVNTDLVQTDVMVFDKKGHFVDGLKAEQFALKIDNKPQTVSFFERVTAGKSPGQNNQTSRPADTGNVANV